MIFKVLLGSAVQRSESVILTHIPRLFWLLFPGGAVVKNLPAKSGDPRDSGSTPGSGRFPGEGMATLSSTLSWRIPQTEELGGLQSVESESDMTEHAHMNALK